MIHSVRFICVLDTNVLCPIVVRDILFWFAHYDLYTPKWSVQIFDEWMELMRKKEIDEKEIVRRVGLANTAFPDAMVENYESLIKGLSLPDEKDCHVLAAAIKTNANLIVTNNLMDFPEEYLATFSLAAKNPDYFITDLIDLNQNQTRDAFKEIVLHRTNPPMDEYQVLDSLRNNGLKNAADYLHSLI